MSAAPGEVTTLPAGVRPYRRTPVFDQDTMPPGLRRDHSTRAGVWGRVTVLGGRLRLVFLDTGAETVLDPDTAGIVAPTRPHRVDPLGSVRFVVEFCAAAQEAVAHPHCR